VHHFCPSGLQRIDKNIVFVVDTSERSKLEEIKIGLKDMFEELMPGDLFNLVAYSSALTYWNSRTVVPATSANIASAKSFITSLNISTGLSMSY